MRQPICAWLAGKRVLIVERSTNSALIAKDGKLQTIEGRQLALISCVAPPPEEVAEAKPKQRRDCDPIKELRRELVRRPGLARSTAKQLGIDEAIADEVVAELMDGYTPPATKASERVLAFAEDEVVPRIRSGETRKDVAKATGRDHKTIDTALQTWQYAHTHEHLEPREIAFRLGRDQIDKHKLGFHLPRPTQRSAEQVARNHQRRLQGAAQRRVLNKRIDQLMAKCVSAIKSRPSRSRLRDVCPA
jgi:hypothetical protein